MPRFQTPFTAHKVRPVALAVISACPPYDNVHGMPTGPAGLPGAVLDDLSGRIAQS